MEGEKRKKTEGGRVSAKTLSQSVPVAERSTLPAADDGKPGALRRMEGGPVGTCLQCGTIFRMGKTRNQASMAVSRRRGMSWRLKNNEDDIVPHWLRSPMLLWVSIAILVFAVSGCAHYPVNSKLSHYDPRGGYRRRNFSAAHPDNQLLLLLSFSGGRDPCGRLFLRGAGNAEGYVPSR